MKKLLPTSTSLSVNKKGFTLIELMIVISIIAILSVIGMVIYSGIQKNARDARRRADIDSIGNAMEANYGKTTPGLYNALVGTMFSSGVIPADPINSGTGCGGSTSLCTYCASSNTATAPTGAACTTVTVPNATSLSGGTSGAFWTVCANLEGTAGTFYCRSNQQ